MIFKGYFSCSSCGYVDYGLPVEIETLQDLSNCSEDPVLCPSCELGNLVPLSDDTSKIRREVDEVYRKKKELDARLHALRLACSHSKLRLGLAEWRVGSLYNAVVCSNCDQIMRRAEEPLPPPVITTSDVITE